MGGVKAKGGRRSAASGSMPSMAGSLVMAPIRIDRTVPSGRS
ncbi:hypothetical protein CSC42_6918 [Pseudomonas aeruginosa]|nr:hypothetical protein CSC42_6918 [Pseudomonas aeruginosa]